MMKIYGKSKESMTTIRMDASVLCTTDIIIANRSNDDDYLEVFA